MGDGERLLAAIIADPDDNLARLAYADWCEEAGGDRERLQAEFIRLQLSPGYVQFHTEIYSDQGFGVNGRPITREQRLHTCLLPGLRLVGWDDDATCYTPGADGHVRRIDVTFRRGFVAEVRCALEQWLDHGPAIAKAHPLERVEIMDRRPAGPSDLPTDMKAGVARGWKWWGLAEDDPDGFSPMDLPSPIWMALEAAEVERRMKIYPEKQAAKDALSAACIRWARGQSIGMK